MFLSNKRKTYIKQMRASFCQQVGRFRSQVFFLEETHVSFRNGVTFQLFSQLKVAPPKNGQQKHTADRVFFCCKNPKKDGLASCLLRGRPHVGRRPWSCSKMLRRRWGVFDVGRRGSYFFFCFLNVFFLNNLFSYL